MIFEVHVWKTANGKLYIKALDESDVWKYLDNEDIDLEDVIWDQDVMGDSIEYVTQVKRNEKGEIVEVDDEFDEASDEEFDFDDQFESDASFERDDGIHVIDIEDMYDNYYNPFPVRTCKWEDGCGGCPYFDDCALVQ